MSLITMYSETLTKVGLKYVQAPENFKASKIFPVCPVNTISGEFPTYGKEYWMKNEAAVRTPGTESQGGVHGRGTDTYQCVDISFHEDVADEYVANEPDPLNPLKAATSRVTQKIAIYDEVYFAANFFATGKWGTNEATPSTLWDAASSDPMGDVDTYKQAMKVATGFDPNKLVISRTVYDVVKRHSTVKEQLKYTSSRVATAAILAGLFEVDEITVLNAVYDSAAYGATASQSFIAGDHALLLHTPASPSLEAPSAGYNFQWRGYGQGGYGVRKIRQENEMATRVEAHNYHQMKQMATDLGYLILQPIA